jgi:xylan 1,4-beta-xylosidase
MKTIFLRYLFALLTLLTCQLSTFAQSSFNPVLPGDYPDPSVIKVGKDYWATATSSEWAPHFPILHSSDLINWRVAGAVFTSPPTWSVSNYWAPELFYNRNRFYVYYTARRRNGPLCVAVASSARAIGPYTDHGPLVCQEIGSIDGFAVRDENQRLHLIWKEDGNSKGRPTPLWLQPLSADGTRLAGTRHELFRNDKEWEGDLIEGPAIIRRDGWFYLFYSGNGCCGRNCNYALGVARARKLAGPWEKFSDNPILKGNRSWLCPGHGTLVRKGFRDVLLYHAYHPKDSIYVGRQGLIDEITWEKSGWPSINSGNGPGIGSIRKTNFVDEFERALAPGWQWPVNNRPLYRINKRSGSIVLTVTKGAEAVLARSTHSGNYTATTVLDPSSAGQKVRLGLAAYGDAGNNLSIAYESGNLLLLQKRDREERVLQKESIQRSSSLWLRIQAEEGHKFQFSYSSDGKLWKLLKSNYTNDQTPPWDRGTRIALIVSGPVGSNGRFHRFSLDP